MHHNIPSGFISVSYLVSFILYLINLVAVVMIITGLVRIIVAFTHEDSPDYNKSVMITGTGIALLTIRYVIFYQYIEDLLIKLSHY